MAPIEFPHSVPFSDNKCCRCPSASDIDWLTRLRTRARPHAARSRSGPSFIKRISQHSTAADRGERTHARGRPLSPCAVSTVCPVHRVCCRAAPTLGGPLSAWADAQRTQINGPSQSQSIVPFHNLICGASKPLFKDIISQGCCSCRT